MKGRIIIIPVDPRTPASSKELAGAPRLEELREGVGGDIETVPFFTTYKGEIAVAFCNEHGKLDGLPVNRRATALWYAQEPRFIGRDHLVGPVVIVTGDRALMRRL